MPVTIAKAYASLCVILPEATGRLAVRFIKASVSFSTAWFIAFAEPVISMPAKNNNKTEIRSNFTFGASR